MANHIPLNFTPEGASRIVLAEMLQHQQLALDVARHTLEDARRLYSTASEAIERLHQELQDKEAIKEMAKRDINELSESVASLERALADKRAALHPIRRLPVEILENIFLRYQGQNGFRTAMKVASVCKKWRAAALGIPKLWRRIRFKTSSGGYPHLLPIVARRGQQDIHLTLTDLSVYEDMSNDDMSSDGMGNEDHVGELLEANGLHTSIVSRLSLHSHKISEIYALGSWRTRFSNVRTLQITLESQRRAVIPEKFLQCLPALQKIHLNDVFLPFPNNLSNLRSITQLELNSTDPPTRPQYIHNILRSAQSLSTLVMFVGHAICDINFRCAGFSLQNLTSLSLEAPRLADVHAVLKEFISLPKLEELSLYSFPCPSLIVNSILPFFSRLSTTTSLTTFYFKPWTPTGGPVPLGSGYAKEQLKLLRYFASINALQIEFEDFQNTNSITVFEVLSDLMRRNTEPLFPSLIAIEFYSLTTSMETLIRLIQSRNAASKQRPNALAAISGVLWHNDRPSEGETERLKAVCHL